MNKTKKRLIITIGVCLALIGGVAGIYGSSD